MDESSIGARGALKPLVPSYELGGWEATSQSVACRSAASLAEAQAKVRRVEVDIGPDPCPRKMGKRGY